METTSDAPLIELDCAVIDKGTEEQLVRNGQHNLFLLLTGSQHRREGDREGKERGRGVREGGRRRNRGTTGDRWKAKLVH